MSTRINIYICTENLNVQKLLRVVLLLWTFKHSLTVRISKCRVYVCHCFFSLRFQCRLFTVISTLRLTLFYTNYFSPSTQSFFILIFTSFTLKKYLHFFFIYKFFFNYYFCNLQQIKKCCRKIFHLDFV